MEGGVDGESKSSIYRDLIGVERVCSKSGLAAAKCSISFWKLDSPPQSDAFLRSKDVQYQ